MPPTVWRLLLDPETALSAGQLAAHRLSYQSVLRCVKGRGRILDWPMPP
jgi:hypothetical protein